MKRYAIAFGEDGVAGDSSFMTDTIPYEGETFSELMEKAFKMNARNRPCFVSAIIDDSGLETVEGMSALEIIKAMEEFQGVEVELPKGFWIIDEMIDDIINIITMTWCGGDSAWYSINRCAKTVVEAKALFIIKPA